MMSLSIEAQTTDKNTIFAIVEGETFASGSTVTFDDITLTFGEAGGPDFLPAKADLLNSDFSAYTPGNNVNGNKAGGTFYVFKPQKAGEITIGVKQNRNKALYIEEDGVVMTQFNGITLTEEQPDSYLFTVAVKAGSTYKLYCAGSKLGLYGFIFKTGENSQEPADTFETAAEAVKNMKVGWNLGYTLDSHLDVESPYCRFESFWVDPVMMPKFFEMLHKAGINAVRLPVTWFPHMDSSGRVDDKWMKRVHEVVDYIIDEGMYCILNTCRDASSDFSWLWADGSYYEVQERFCGLWSQIATEFKDYDEHLQFSAWNEILERQEIFGGESYKDRYKVLNQINQDFVNAVRSTGGNNIYRNLIVGPYYNWSVYEGDEIPQHFFDSFQALAVPSDIKPGHISFEVHAYYNTNEPDVDKRLDTTIREMKTYLMSKNVPVIFSEWGPSGDWRISSSKTYEFAKRTMEQTKANNIAVFPCTGPLSEGVFRTLPAFESKEFLEAILKGYYGEDYEAPIPTINDFNVGITYTELGQRFTLVEDPTIDTSKFKGFLLELQQVDEGQLELFVVSNWEENRSIKIPITSTSTYIPFPDERLGKEIISIFLRHAKDGQYRANIKKSVLLSNDGEEFCRLDVWDEKFTSLPKEEHPGKEFETASEAVKNMKVGYCLSNTLDAFADSWIGETHSWQEYETVWGNPITKPEFMKMIRKAGFNAVRVSVTWFPHMDVDGKIDEAWMKRVHEVVDYVIDQGMYCILNSHHDTSHKDAWLWADDSYYKIQEQYRGLWSQIATEFKDYDEHLLFAGWNEILERQEIFGGESYKDRYKVLNQINQDFVDAVRSSGGNNIFRNLVVGPYYNWSVYEGDETPQHYIDSFLSLTIPNDVKPGHILFEVHMYFKTNDSDVNKVINRTIEDANTYLASKKVPIVIGEWGPANEYDNPSIVDAFAHYFMEQTRANNMVSFAWTGPLSYGEYRNLPAFEDPSYIRAIMKGYYGDDYEPVLITKEDYDDKGQRKQFVHTVGFDNIWAELNIFSDDIPLKVKNYKGIRVEFAEPINVDDFVIKVYADNGAVEEGRTPNSSTSATILFSDFNVNDVINRVTLQYCKKNKADVKVIGAWLIRQDDTEEYSDLSPFWGCEITNKENYVTGISTIKHSLKVGSPQAIYNLNGQRISEPRKGINIIDGKKVIK